MGVSQRPPRRSVAARRGRANRVIAQELFVTLTAVELHLSSAYRKLGSASAASSPTKLEEPGEPGFVEFSRKGFSHPGAAAP
jgi:hypothetical protein